MQESGYQEAVQLPLRFPSMKTGVWVSDDWGKTLQILKKGSRLE